MRLALLCSAIALLAAGCGNGAPLSRPDFIVQANTICRTLTDQEHADPRTDPATTFNNTLGYLKDAVGKLDKLNPPATSQAPFKDMMTHFHSMLTFLDKNTAFLVALTVHLQQNPRDTKALDRFQTFIKPFDDDAAAAKSDAETLVLPACAAGLGSAGN